MAVKLQVYKEMRLVPVRFERAKTGAPDEEFPDIDDRGHNFKVPAMGIAESKEIRGPVIGLRKSQKIKIKLVREQIDHSAPLFISSSDDDVIKVTKPASGVALATGKSTIIELEGGDFAQANPKSAKIEVRYESKTGPIIYELTAYVFSPLPVFLQPHIVTINNNAGTGGVKPAINVDNVMAQVKALWASSGVKFIVQPSKEWSVNLPTANKMMWGDVNTVLAKMWQANTVNIYVVREIDGALGLGISKAAHTGFGINKPCVFAGEKSGAIVRADTYWWANDVAHELGHFFTLWHPTDGPSASNAWKRYDTWSMRFLMHNWNYTGRAGPPGDPADWPTFNNFGYGQYQANQPFRGGMVPLKNVRTGLDKAGRDGQCSEARTHILKGPASLY